MSRFEVEPAGLRLPASDADRVGETLQGVRAHLLSVAGPDTGRAVTTSVLTEVLDGLCDDLGALAQASFGDAVALRFAGARYAAAERTAGGGPCT